MGIQLRGLLGWRMSLLKKSEDYVASSKKRKSQNDIIAQEICCKQTRLNYEYRINILKKWFRLCLGL